MQISLGNKLYAGFGFILFLTVMTALLTFTSVKSNDRLQHRIIDLRIPTALASKDLTNGINSSLAALRGYLILGDNPEKGDAMKASRRAAWDNIDKANQQLNALAPSWTNADNRRDLAQVGDILLEFRKAQQDIEDISHTVNNIESYKILLEKAAPKAAKVLAAITSIINEEASLEATAERKVLLKNLADMRGSFSIGLANIRAYLLSGDSKFKNNFNKNWQTNNASLNALKTTTDLFTNTQNKHWKILTAARSEFASLPPLMFSKRSAKDWNKANYYLGTEAAPRATKLKALLGEMLKSQGSLLDADAIASIDSSAKLLAIVVGGSVVSIILGLLMAFTLSKNILGSLLPVVNRASEIANNDISGNDLPIKSNDELGNLTRSMNSMSHSLKSVMNETSDSIQEVAAGAEKIHRSNQEMFKEVESQTSIIDLIATATEELSISAAEVATNSIDSATSASAAKEAAGAGGDIMDKLLMNMEEISQAFNSTTLSVNSLEQLGGEIEAIIQVIKGIADQTNLLALNAAIEAARAGEQGRGFSVVADEVRQLAQRTTEATEEVTGAVSKILQSTKDTSQRMSSGVSSVQTGLDSALQAKESLESIVDGATQVESRIQSIASIAEQQSQVVKEIAQNVSSAFNMAQQTQAQVTSVISLAQEVESTATGKANQIQGMVSTAN